MNKKFLLLGIILLAGMIGCTPASRIDSGSIEVRNENINARVVFHEKDRATIIDYYSHARKAKNLPPGLAKKDTLPPGLQKHIVKNGALPPGLQTKNLPYELEKTLSPLPEGFVRLKVGADVVLMNEKTRIVFGVISGLD